MHAWAKILKIIVFNVVIWQFYSLVLVHNSAQQCWEWWTMKSCHFEYNRMLIGLSAYENNFGQVN